jgi:hypothetical protein
VTTVSKHAAEDLVERIRIREGAEGLEEVGDRLEVGLANDGYE